MNVHSNRDTLEERLRHALQTVASTVTEGSVDRATASPVQATRQRRRRIVLGLGAVAVPLVLAASAFVHRGSEYVTPIPPGRIVAQGSAGGSDYLLIESDRTDECGAPVTGVELVDESQNLEGGEWRTTGYEYGLEPQPPDFCGYDEVPYLANPALFNAGGAEVGDALVWVYAVHPDVDTVRITAGHFTEDVGVHEVDGAGYAVFEIPQDIDDYTSELLVDGHVVPGSEQAQQVRRP